MLTSVQRRIILHEAGLHPYLGGKTPFNPIIMEPIVVGPANVPTQSIEVSHGDNTLLDKIIKIIKDCVGTSYSEEEIRTEATKLLDKYLNSDDSI